ncbi:hypothetical protein J8L85_17800 [Maribacter sp. MMG018]|uniref:hypothetical protein n=1 Tax=Maribacter sp. MMG018 TaxID=2822688 RepID=UPI001B35B257|nr:hypothetical protein [Maribacter sp. MMG018]MBQ4916308.1 hypothetical protein [Maribacter sp. MMG018]
MKAILTLSLTLFFSAISFAQSTHVENKVDVSTTGVVQMTETIKVENFGHKESIDTNSVARLYRYKNSRVKKALFFTTKKDRPKLA